MSGIGPTCGCGRVHPFGAVRAIGRFSGPRGYVTLANPDKVYATRDEARRAVCPQWVATQTIPDAVVVSGTESEETP